LQGASAVMAWVTCALPVLLGFVVPASYLIDASVSRIRFAGIPANIIAETFNTLTVAGIATALTLVLAFLVAYAARLGGSMARALLRVASLGYAVPGAVLAIGLLPVITSIERGVHATSTQLLGIGTGLFLLGSGAAIVCAYVVRFLAIPAGSIESGFNRVSPSMDAAARMLGKTAGGTLWHVHLPMLRPALAAGALLVFVDCMKELPATLLLRPLGFETLATHLYGEAIRGTYEEAAIAALLIVVAGLLPVILLTKGIRSAGAH